MTTAVARRSMPRRKDAAPRHNDVSVKMDGEVVRKAKIAAAYKGQNLAEFLSETLGGIIDRLLDEYHAKETQASRPARSKAKPEKG